MCTWLGGLSPVNCLHGAPFFTLPFYLSPCGDFAFDREPCGLISVFKSFAVIYSLGGIKTNSNHWTRVCGGLMFVMVIVLRMGIVMVSNRGHSIIVSWWCIRLP